MNDPLTELYELLICTGMRKGEALGQHWADVDLDARLLYVRHAVTAPWSQTEEFWGGGDPATLAQFVGEFAVLARTARDAGHRLYCWVCV